MNISASGSATPDSDPLGLSDLPAPKPESGSVERDWEAVSAALDVDERHRRQWWYGALAAAATVAFVLAIATIPRHQPENIMPGEQIAVEPSDAGSSQETTDPSRGTGQPTTEDLIAMSQQMERQLHQVRGQVGSMPSEFVVYQVELQDLIGQVDDALSMSPGSQALWGQRLSLQMDLMKLYRNQLRRDYSHLASM